MRVPVIVFVTLLAMSAMATNSTPYVHELDSLAVLFDTNQVPNTTIHRLSGRLSDPPNLHGYEMLDQTSVGKSAQITLLQELEYELKHLRSGTSLCFSPRHPISLSVRDDRYDILVCYECGRMKIFKNSVEIASTDINNMSSNKIIDLFQRNGVTGHTAGQ